KKTQRSEPKNRLTLNFIRYALCASLRSLPAKEWQATLIRALTPRTPSKLSQLNRFFTRR
ncbi:hypothetical protein, partial [Secundilactobacillus silagei]|uniref:hypothetical protein n=1 Tax=Secundilactobacillus silagei TaxID=1293415 RepID=UPI001CDA8FC7